MPLSFKLGRTPQAHLLGRTSAPRLTPWTRGFFVAQWNNAASAALMLSGTLGPARLFSGLTEESVMDKDRVAGSAKQVRGAVKEVVGKVVGDAKLESEGKADKAAGKVQNAIGGVKDAVRDAVKK